MSTNDYEERYLNSIDTMCRGAKNGNKKALECFYKYRLDYSKNVSFLAFNTLTKEMYQDRYEMIKYEALNYNAFAALLYADCIYNRYNEGIEEINAEESINWYLESAFLGNDIAAATLAMFYHKGILLEKDEKEAMKWMKYAYELETKEKQDETANAGINPAIMQLLGRFYQVIESEKNMEEAAKYLYYSYQGGNTKLEKVLKGDAELAYHIGLFLYESEPGEYNNNEEALMWFETAAKLGNADALFHLGYYHYIDTEDYSTAFKYFNEAYKKKCSNKWVLIYLADCYLYGWGVEKSIGNAASFYLAAKNQNADEEVRNHAISTFKKNGELCYAVGRIMEKRENPSESVIDWYKKAADLGKSQAYYQLAKCYDLAKGGVERDEYTAFKYYEMASEKGVKDSYYYLGYFYYKGISGNKDLKIAAKYLIEASRSAASEEIRDKSKRLIEKDRDLSYYAAYYLLDTDKGMSNDNKEAARLFKISADLGDETAMNYLGRCYDEGWGVNKNQSTAVQWYEKAAINGNAYGCRNLAICYQAGYGVEKDDGKAIALYKRAMEIDPKDNIAPYKLGEIYEKYARASQIELGNNNPRDYSELPFSRRMARTLREQDRKEKELLSRLAEASKKRNVEYWTQCIKYYKWAAHLGNKDAIKKCEAEGWNYNC